ncbi:hypothetical protein F7725_010679 [Dissostichus mawsoni]|uniref:Uncharacterized protein n=1 Tax=Dissostichus mawsoni TaxID=36200 RepID=A0A7J5XPP2_DISMA|nr:hypothetical protein F7725_010679 [Dissostichus mawsoni]
MTQNTFLQNKKIQLTPPLCPFSISPITWHTIYDPVYYTLLLVLITLQKAQSQSVHIRPRAKVSHIRPRAKVSHIRPRAKVSHIRPRAKVSHIRPRAKVSHIRLRAKVSHIRLRAKVSHIRATTP